MPARRVCAVKFAANRGRKSFLAPVLVTVVGIEMAMGMRMPRAIRMFMLVLMENNFQTSPERVGDPTQGGKARHMIAAFQARDHGLGHAETPRQTSLRLTRVIAKLEQTTSTFSRDHSAAVDRAIALRRLL